MTVLIDMIFLWDWTAVVFVRMLSRSTTVALDNLELFCGRCFFFFFFWGVGGWGGVGPPWISMNIISMNHISKHRPTITTKKDSKYCTATAICSGKMDHLQKSHNLLHTQVEKKHVRENNRKKQHNLDTIIDTSTKTTSNDTFFVGLCLGPPAHSMENLNASKDLWEHRRLQGKMWRCKKWSIQSWNVESELMEVIDQLFIYAYLHNINLPGTKIGQTFYVDQSTQFLIEYLKLIYYWAALSDWLLCWTRCPTSSNIELSKFM